MIDFFTKLLDTSDFPSRWNCGDWDSFHGWLHIVSDLLIWGAYGAIPIALIYFCGKKRSEILYTRIVVLFACFIVACGTTHLLEAIIFYHPIYRLAGLMKFVTAVVSWVTVIVVWKNLPAAIELPGMAKLNAALGEELDKRRAAEQEVALAHQELQQLTALIAHDLRNPLSSALMMSDIVKEQAASAGASGISSQMDAVVTSLKKIRDSLQQLDDSTKGESNGNSSQEVDLNEVIVDLKTFLASSLVSSGATIEVADLPSVIADRSKLFHLMVNLVENSIKYRSEEPPLIRIESETDDDWHRIVVQDNGRGIAEDDLEKIFRSEYRGANGTETPGTGMGLAHCRRIVSNLGGTIEAGHSDDGGARFVIEIPVAASEEAESH